MDDKTIDSIFAGSLESLPPVSSKIVRIFTSSTFTGVFLFRDNLCPLHKIVKFCFFLFWHLKDTTMERNSLMAKCYPRIKDYCREKHGLEFQVFADNLTLHNSKANSEMYVCACVWVPILAGRGYALGCS